MNRACGCLAGVIVALWILHAAFAGAVDAPGLLDGMISAWESSRTDDTSYFADSSADTPANYLLALAWGKDALPHERVRRDAALLYRDLRSREISSGRCIGWGIGAPLDAFSDGSINPADTIYLYTTARVIIALLEAEKAGLIRLDHNLLRGASCTLRTLFDFDPKIPRLHYSNNSNDAQYVVYNVFADFARAGILLGRRLHDARLLATSRQACAVLRDRQRQDGSLPYFEGGVDNDAVHHAMVVVGLYKCAEAFSGDYSPAVKGARMLVEHFIGPDGGLIAELPNKEWALGESLVALGLVCAQDKQFCLPIATIGNYVISHDVDGLIGNRNARFQSWLAVGVAFVGERTLSASSPRHGVDAASRDRQGAKPTRLHQ